MIILTPNRRLAAFTVQQYNSLQESTGLKTWATPDVYPLEIWLIQLWDQCLDHNFAFYKPLLAIKQQQLLFEQIIQNNHAHTELLRINATAQNALQAWNFLAQWRIPLETFAAYAAYSADAQALQQWLTPYLAWLTDHEYVDFNLLVKSLVENVDQLISLIPKEICLKGFNELTPQYALFFSLLRERGISIELQPREETNATVTRLGVQNADAELNSAVEWIKAHLEHNTAQRFGVVVPDLAQRRDRVCNYFTTQLPKQWLNISAPKSLLDYEIISIAVLILKMASNVVAFNDFSILLRSPFIGNFSSHAAERALLDRELRKSLEAQFNFNHLLQIVSPDHEIKEYLTKFSAATKNLHGKHSTYYWVDKIQALLQAWGWPGERLGFSHDAGLQALSKDDADLLSCWQDLLAEYASLDSILQQHTFSEAIQYLRRFAAETPFAPAETGLTKIHVLGLLEAEGLVFDHLWVCGMSRDQWPPTANPNPFIPLELQREYDLPHSSAQRELTMARKYTQTLQHGGIQNVTFCYPEFVDDNQVAPSNLITHLPVLVMPTRNKAQSEPDIQLEEWYDPHAAPLAAAYIAGGTKVLQLQAQCPFKATAEVRLKATELHQPQSILTPDKRGSLVHSVLEEFWRTCKSHAQLVAYTSAELELLVTQVIQKMLSTWQKKLPHTLTNTYIMLEAHRLYNLLMNWLAYEKTRPPFVVHELEQKKIVNIGGLQINMQIDRVDVVDGQLVIIDYKTGATQLYAWSKDTVYEPQLQIYALGTKGNVVAVAFAALIPNFIKFKGVAAEDDLLPNVIVVTEWQELLQTWSQQLEAVALDFITGQAQVAPYDSKVCRHCKLQALCRVYEQ